MIKPNLQKILITLIFIPLLGSSCKKKSDNFDIDLSTFQIPQKTTVKVFKKETSDSSQTKTEDFESKLLPYKKNSEVLDSIIFGKKDPFSENKTFINTLNTQLKLTGFLNTKKEQYAFVNYLDKEGTITINSIGGVNTNLLPYGAKVIKIDSKNMKLIINFANENFIFEI